MTMLHLLTELPRQWNRTCAPVLLVPLPVAGGDFLGKVALLEIVSTRAAGPWYGETSIVFDVSRSGG